MNSYRTYFYTSLTCALLVFTPLSFSYADEGHSGDDGHYHGHSTSFMNDDEMEEQEEAIRHIQETYSDNGHSPVSPTGPIEEDTDTTSSAATDNAVVRYRVNEDLLEGVQRPQRVFNNIR